MSRIRSKNTKPERTLRSALFRKGLRFRIHRKGLPGRPDIVFVSGRLAVFCHGCFWHGHDGCYREPKSNTEFWRAKLESNRTRDTRDKERLEAMGWRVVQVWECRIRKDLDNVVEEIRNLLSQPPPSAAL